MPQTFTTRIELGGKTATGFRIPTEIVDALGQGKKPKVLVTIGSHTYRSTVAVYGGEFMLPLNATNREAAGLSAGDITDVTIELDREERTIDIPGDLALALDQQPGSRTRFAALSYSTQRKHVQAVVSAKRAETRERRITSIVSNLTQD